MVIAKPKWFKRNNNGVFGIFGYPWQSIVYVLLIFSFALSAIFLEGLMTKLISMAFFCFLLIEGLIAYQKSLDERQVMRHAIVFRNAFWGIFIIFTIIQAFNYNLNPNYHFLGNMTYLTTLSNTLPPAITYNLNPENIFILTILPLIGGCLIAIVTYYQLDMGSENRISNKIVNNSKNMLIVRPKWFKRRNKSNYWIFDISWKGVAYILALILLILFVGSGNMIMALLSVLLLIFMAVNYLIAYQKSLDERQRFNHAIADKNAFLGFLAIFIIVQAILFTYNLNLEYVYLLIPLPIVVGFLMAVSTYYKLQREVLFI